MTRTNEERRPQTTDGAQRSLANATVTPIADSSKPVLDTHFGALRSVVDRFAVRLLEDALTAAMPFHWLRRAAQLDECRPRPGDFVGAATPAELAERDARLAEQAEACREHARFLMAYPDVLAEMVAADVAALAAEGVSDAPVRAAA